MLRIIKLCLFSFCLLGITTNALANEKRLQEALSAAQERSAHDQRSLKKQAESERDRRMQNWSHRQIGTIEIKHSTPVPSNFDLGIDADLDEEESGEDNSGLNKLRGTVEEESTDINFDDELREVSMVD